MRRGRESVVSIYTVKIRELTTQASREVCVRAEDEAEALSRGVAKAYGPRCALHQDSGLPRGYGQIVRSLSPAERSRRASGATWAADCVTDRVRVEVSRIEGSLS